MNSQSELTEKITSLSVLHTNPRYTHPLSTVKHSLQRRIQRKDDMENAQGQKENKSYEFDDLLRMTGGFSRSQTALSAFLCLISILSGVQVLIQMFYGATPPFSCVQISGNETCDPGKCHPNCRKYEFSGLFTSAVSEVIVAQCLYIVKHTLDHFSVKL